MCKTWIEISTDMYGPLMNLKKILVHSKGRIYLTIKYMNIISVRKSRHNSAVHTLKKKKKTFGHGTLC